MREQLRRKVELEDDLVLIFFLKPELALPIVVKAHFLDGRRETRVFKKIVIAGGGGRRRLPGFRPDDVLSAQGKRLRENQENREDREEILAHSQSDSPAPAGTSVGFILTRLLL